MATVCPALLNSKHNPNQERAVTFTDPYSQLMLSLANKLSLKVSTFKQLTCVHGQGLESSPTDGEDQWVTGLEDLGAPSVLLHTQFHQTKLVLSLAQATHQQGVAGVVVLHKLKGDTCMQQGWSEFSGLVQQLHLYNCVDNHTCTTAFQTSPTSPPPTSVEASHNCHVQQTSWCSAHQY